MTLQRLKLHMRELKMMMIIAIEGDVRSPARIWNERQTGARNKANDEYATSR